MVTQLSITQHHLPLQGLLLIGGEGLNKKTDLGGRIESFIGCGDWIRLHSPLRLAALAQGARSRFEIVATRALWAWSLLFSVEPEGSHPINKKIHPEVEIGNWFFWLRGLDSNQ